MHREGVVTLKQFLGHWSDLRCLKPAGLANFSLKMGLGYQSVSCYGEEESGLLSTTNPNLLWLPFLWTSPPSLTCLEIPVPLPYASSSFLFEKQKGQAAERSRVNLESRAELGKRGTELTWSQSQSSGWDRTSMELSGTQVLEGLWWERSLYGQLAWSLGTHFDCFKIGIWRGLERGLWVPSLSGW